jgi:hypothetical protein
MFETTSPARAVARRRHGSGIDLDHRFASTLRPPRRAEVRAKREVTAKRCKGTEKGA